ncbi:MAG: prolipoprotein diacylglyceryl transferase [bacterium]|nr:prolipoprotein diacylglyceryl transferase [Gammaproteobacteria bacterium]HIL94421.1 prolipoprotein diacylglyceryl transferase [Pseudomonadales bacterium]
MWNYPQIDPVAISLGPIAIHWYALSYLVGISMVWWHLTRRSKVYGSKTPALKGGPIQLNDEQISDMIFYGVLGVILGGRVGYMLFYGQQELIQNPLSIFTVWKGGMSFHGGMLGVFIAAFLFARKQNTTFFHITDFIAPSIPIALGMGRIGNFVNAELPGRLTDVPWAVIYPGDVVARHPSSLYQAMLEGPILFLILWLFTRQPRPLVSVSGMFMVGYGCLRFTSEFFREPDLHLGFIAFDWLTTGQLLCMPMVLFGLALLVYSYNNRDQGLFPDKKVSTHQKH